MDYPFRSCLLRNQRWLVFLLLLGLGICTEPQVSWARGASGGGGRSSFSSSSSGRSSFGSGASRSSYSSSPSSSGFSSRTSPSSGFSAPNTSPSSSGWGTSSRFSGSSQTQNGFSAPTSSRYSGSSSSGSRTDAALAQKSGQGGRTFTNRSEAANDFKQKYATQYTSTFNSEPAARPSYIPRTTVVNGNTYNVYYDYSHHGYGYWEGPVWRTYDVMADAVMLGMLMQHHNYVYNDYGPGYGYGPAYGPGYSTYTVYHRGGGILSGIVCVFILIIIALIITRAFRF